MNTKTASQTGSQVVAALEAAWRQLQKSTDLPDVVIIVGSGAREGKWGHTWADRWAEGHPTDDQGAALDLTTRKTEVFISGERLACGAKLTLQTLAHEAAHVLAHTRGVQDTSRQGRYHNKRFVELATLFGLEWAGDQAHSTIGFSEVTMTAEGEQKFAKVIAQLDKAIALYLPGFTASTGAGTTPRTRRPGAGKSSNLVKATCSCDTPRIIRVAPSTLDLAPITCGECGERFTRPGEAGESFEVVLVNMRDGSVAGHIDGCADLKRTSDHADDPWPLTVHTKHEAYVEYNADFIAESGEVEGHWPIDWRPCADEVPAS